MKKLLTVIGGAAGGWSRGMVGAVLGAGAGWVLGWLLTPIKEAVPLPEEEHYLRYPEEEIVDALCAAADEPAAEGAAMDDLYREVAGEG